MRGPWFSSDPHFGHLKLVSVRGFSHVDAMNETLVAQHNAVVAPNDIAYILGDVILGRYNEHTHYTQALNGYLIASRGNHDPSVEKLRRAGFHEVVEQTYVKVHGLTLWLAHMPLDNSADPRNLHRPAPI